MKNKIILFVAMLFAVLALTACGEVSYDKIGGDWKAKTINGETVEEYSKKLSLPECMGMVTFKVSDDDKVVLTAVNASDLTTTTSQTYKIKRASNGFEVLQPDSEEIFFSVTYDEKENTLAYSVDPGTGVIKYVLEKGSYDFDTALAEYAASTAGGTEDATDETADETEDATEDAADETEEAAEDAFGAEDIAGLLMGHTWADDDGFQVTYNEDATYSAATPEGEEITGGWDVADMEDGTVVFSVELDGEQSDVVVTGCSADTISFEDGSTFTFVE